MRFVAVLVGLFLVGCGGVGQHRVTPWPVAERRANASWERTFAQPTALRVTAWVTGAVLASPDILIDPDNPRTPTAERKAQWVPSVTYLVEHPTQGRFLMDTGVSALALGPCAYGLRPFYWVPCRTAAGRDVVARLHERGLSARDLRFVMMSHFHGDHVGGLKSLLSDGLETVLTTPEEWAAVTSWKSPLEGYLDDQVRGTYAVRTLDRTEAVAMPHLGRVWDLFGDGSVWLLPVMGHTRGQLAALLNTESGPLLLTFDASHIRSNLERRIVPRMTVNATQALGAIDRLRAFRAAYPSVRVLYGHEPTQWTPGREEVVLAHPRESSPTPVSTAPASSERLCSSDAP